MITEADMPKYLGRPLTTLESENYALYLNIAEQQLDDLLCMTLCSKGASRTYQSREHYSTLFTDPFKSVLSVTKDGVAVDAEDYTVMQNDKFNGSWYNSIVFDTELNGEKIVVEADWGFSKVPYDLAMLVSKLFKQVSVDQSVNTNVKTKRTEDFSITYKDESTMDSLVSSNQVTIDKYSLCHVGNVQHGDTDYGYYGLRRIYD